VRERGVTPTGPMWGARGASCREPISLILS
jgi:hypothetical protein